MGYKKGNKTNVTIYKPNRKKEEILINSKNLFFINTDEKWFYEYSNDHINKISFSKNKYKTLWTLKASGLHHEFYVDENFNISVPQYFHNGSKKFRKNSNAQNKVLVKDKTTLFEDIKEKDELNIIYLTNNFFFKLIKT
jgi:hypothetical protein